MSNTEMPERIWGWRNADNLGSLHGWNESRNPRSVEYVRADIHAAAVAKRDEWHALWQELLAAGYEQKARAEKAEAQVAEMTAALTAAKEMIDKALPKFNWGASFLDAEAIRLLNETPGKISAAIAGSPAA